MASFPVKPGEQLMLVTDQAKVIRTTVGDIRIAGRNTSGVMILRVGKGEHVVSVAKIDESDDVEVDGLDAKVLMLIPLLLALGYFMRRSQRKSDTVASFPLVRTRLRRRHAVQFRDYPTRPATCSDSAS